MKSSFITTYASNEFPALLCRFFLSPVFFFVKRSFTSFADRSFPHTFFQMIKSHVLSALSRPLFPLHAKALLLSTIGFPHFGHLRPVSFAAPIAHVSLPSLICNAASNLLPSFFLNPLITSSVSHKQVQKFLPYLGVYHHKQDINQL